MTEKTEQKQKDGRRLRGDNTRALTVSHALQMASIDGLEGLSIAKLATALGTAKSTVHAAFGSKETLQVAVIDETTRLLFKLVVSPSLKADSGMARLVAVGDAWMSYLESDIFEGGCVLSSASLEMDGRSGAARDAIAKAMTDWMNTLSRFVADAISNGEIAETHEPEQLAFELNAIGMAANWHHQLLGGEETFHMARLSWKKTLESHKRQN